jgi:hypothetical protein
MMGGPVDAGTFAAATTSDRQSCPPAGSALVKWRLFEPVVSTPDGMVNDLTSQSDPLALNGPPAVSPWKMAGPAATVVPFTTTAWSSKVWPSETTKSMLAVPPEYGTPAMVSSHPAGSNVLVTFESLPLNMT